MEKTNDKVVMIFQLTPSIDTYTENYGLSCLWTSLRIRGFQTLRDPWYWNNALSQSVAEILRRPFLLARTTLRHTWRALKVKDKMVEWDGRLNLQQADDDVIVIVLGFRLISHSINEITLRTTRVYTFQKDKESPRMYQLNKHGFRPWFRLFFWTEF